MGLGGESVRNDPVDAVELRSTQYDDDDDPTVSLTVDVVGEGGKRDSES